MMVNPSISSIKSTTFVKSCIREKLDNWGLQCTHNEKSPCMSQMHRDFLFTPAFLP